MKAPTQKTIFVLIICLASVFAVWIFSKQTKKIAEKNTTLSVVETPKKIDSVDSDEDGLEDWMETLLGTDPQNKDTDGDGTEDGKEVSDERDPRIKGPDDKNPYIMNSLIASNKATTTKANQDETLTDEVSKDLLARYMLLKQSGGQISSDQALQIAELSLDNPDSQIKGVVYTSSDLNITKNTDKTTAGAYEKAFKDSVNRNFTTKGEGRELIILEDSLSLDDEERIKKLDPIIQGYKDFIIDMKKMSVPVDAVSIHLDILNNASLMLPHIEAMRQIFNDPVKTLLAVSAYPEIGLNISMSLQKLDKYFDSKK